MSSQQSLISLGQLIPCLLAHTATLFHTTAVFFKVLLLVLWLTAVWYPGGVQIGVSTGPKYQSLPSYLPEPFPLYSPNSNKLGRDAGVA